MMPSVGIHFGIPFDVYKSWDAINIHGLMPIDMTPAHCRYELDNPREATPEMEVGSAIHIATFEPERFDREYYLGTQEYDGRTKEGKITQAEELLAAGARKVIRKLANRDRVDADSVVGMSQALWHHKPSATFLKMPGRCEVSALWEDPDTGILCKGRFDKLIEPHGRVPQQIIADLKSTGSGMADQFSFSKTIAKFYYDAQAEWYKWGVRTLTGKEPLHVFLVCENTAPYIPNWGSLDDISMQAGVGKFRRWLDLYSKCLKAESWPGYPDTIDGNAPKFTLPKWSL